jgi:hypothetical protein
MNAIGKTALFYSFLPLLFMACKKDSSAGGGGTTNDMITLSKSTVKIEEPLYASVNLPGGQTAVRWSVSPATNAWVSSSNGRSVILFSNAGHYTVTANYFSDSTNATPYDSSSLPVTVSDSLYADSTAYCDVIVNVPIASDDQILLTPLPNADTGLVLLAHTTKTYVNSPILANVQPEIQDGNYAYTFENVLEYPCYGNNAPAPAATELYFGALLNGTHALTLTLNGVVYQGSILVTDHDFTFTWNYTSGITMSPLHINK